MSVQAKSGSELLLGVRSEPKTRLSLSVCPCPVQFVFTELQSGSNFLLGVHSKPKSCEDSVDPHVGYGQNRKKRLQHA